MEMRLQQSVAEWSGVLRAAEAWPKVTEMLHFAKMDGNFFALAVLITLQFQRLVGKDLRTSEKPSHFGMNLVRL